MYTSRREKSSPSTLGEGATENTAVAKGLLEELIERGLRMDRPMLVVIDGAKALRRAVTDVLGEKTPVQRCTVHKKRNVLEYVSKSDRSWVSRRMTHAYNESDEGKARRQLLSLAGELQRINPSAAKSLLEGLEETLTVQRLGLPEPLRRSIRSTNIIESANNGVRDRSQSPGDGEELPSNQRVQPHERSPRSGELHKTRNTSSLNQLVNTSGHRQTKIN
jgi:transposase-like protein